MNFDKLANKINNKINESLSAPEIKDEGRTPGARSAWLAANPGKTGAQYYAMLKKSGSVPPVKVSAEPMGATDDMDDTDDTGDSLEAPLSRGAAKTQAAIDDFITTNPDASSEEVVEHLKSLNSGPVDIKTGYITTPVDVMKMISIAKGEDSIPVPMEPSMSDIDSEKKSKFDKLRRFMMMPRAARDKYLARKRKATDGTDAIENDLDTDEEEIEIDPHVSHYVSAMKKKAYDDTDDEPERVEQN